MSVSYRLSTYTAPHGCPAPSTPTFSKSPHDQKSKLCVLRREESLIVHQVQRKPFEDTELKIFRKEEYENQFISKQIISNEF